MSGVVVALSQGRAKVECDGRVLDCLLCKELALEQQTRVAIGDDVVVQSSADRHTLVACLPRRSVLSRPDPQSPHIERVMAANVNTAVLVASVKAPRLRIKLVDRFLLAAERGGTAPVVCINKLDLLDAAEERETLALLQPYSDLGVPVIACSAANGRGIAELAALLAGTLCVFVGHSGVGKSSILNALDAGLQLRTGDVRKGDGKGRHTTTAATMYRLAGGIRVIDTPGVRELGLTRLTVAELREHFREFSSHAAQCRYGDCTHTSEQGCAVMEAVRDGRLSRARYDSYCRLLEDVDDSTPRRRDGGGRPGSGTADDPAEFTCAHCGQRVSPSGAGSRHRNHCPQCLWSIHLDSRPGDRAACCGGPMEPVAVWVRRGGEWAVIHRCSQCGAFSSNRIAGDDNEALLLSLAVRPLSMPPFPLEKLVHHG